MLSGRAASWSLSSLGVHKRGRRYIFSLSGDEANQVGSEYTVSCDAAVYCPPLRGGLQREGATHACLGRGGLDLKNSEKALPHVAKTSPIRAADADGTASWDQHIKAETRRGEET